MTARKLNSNDKPVYFRMVSNTGNIDGAIGLQSQITIWLSKNGGPLVLAKGTVSEIGKCLYVLNPHPDDRDTLGECVIHAEAPTAYNENERFDVVPYDPFQVTGNPSVDLSGIASLLQQILDAETTNNSYTKVLVNDTVPERDRIP